MSTRLSASQLDRAMACPASFAMPAVFFPTSRESDRGTEIHRFLEMAVTSGREVALAEVPDDAPWRATCEGVDLDVLTAEAERVECEVKFAYRPLSDTARQLGGGCAREYSAVDDEEIASTVDLLLTRPDGGIVVIDYKTGRRSVHVAESGQMHLLGLAVARARGLSQVTASVVHVMEEGALGFDEMILGPDELDRVARGVRTAFARVRDAHAAVSEWRMPDVRVGGHCSFCPAYRACPANVGLAKHLLGASADDFATDGMSPSQVGSLWAWAARARRVLDEIELGLKAYIDHEPVPLPDGVNDIARVETVRESIDGRAAVPVLEAYLGPAAGEVIEPSISKSRLERFVRAEAPSSRDARDILQQLMTGLREGGAIKETISVNYRTRPLRRAGAGLTKTKGTMWGQTHPA
jgi:RecB family exonuclease